jgi:hypothetical protein
VSLHGPCWEQNEWESVKRIHPPSLLATINPENLIRLARHAGPNIVERFALSFPYFTSSYNSALFPVLFLVKFGVLSILSWIARNVSGLFLFIVSYISVGVPILMNIRMWLGGLRSEIREKKER